MATITPIITPISNSQAVYTKRPVRRSCCYLLIQKIKKVLSWFYSLICCRRKIKTAPSISQPTIIKTPNRPLKRVARVERYLTAKNLHQLLSQPKPMKPAAATESGPPQILKQAEDENLETRRVVLATSQKFGALLSEICYVRIGKPLIEAQKKDLDAAIDLFLKSFKFQMMAGLIKGVKFIREELEHYEKTSKDLDPFFKSYLDWLFKGIKPSLADDVEKRLEKEGLVFRNNKNVKDCIKETLSWMPNQLSVPMPSSLAEYEESNVNIVRDTVFAQLIEYKISGIVTQIQSLLNNLGFIEEAIQTNTTEATKIIVNRMMSLVEGLPLWTKIHEIVAFANDQMKAMVELDKHVEAASLAKPLSTQEKEDLYLQEFAKKTCCHSQIKEEIQDAKGNQPKKLEEFLKNVVFPKIAQEIIGIVFPSRKELISKGMTKEIDGITAFWRDLPASKELPPEVKKVLGQLRETGKEMVAPSVFKNFFERKEFDETIKTMLENLVVDNIRSEMHKNLTRFLRAEMVYFTNPIRFKEFTGFIVFPTARVIVLKKILTNHIATNSKQFAPIFHELVKSKNRSDARLKIEEQIYTQIKSRAKAVKFSDKPSDDFKAALGPVIDEIELEMMKQWVSTVIASNHKQLAALFLKHFQGNDAKVTRTAIETELFTYMRKECPEYQAVTSITEEFRSIVAPLIKEIEWQFRNDAESRPKKDIKLSEVEAHLKNYATNQLSIQSVQAFLNSQYGAKAKDNNFGKLHDLYSDLLKRLIFDMGGKESIAKGALSLKKVTTPVIASMEWMGKHNEVTEIGCDLLDATFGHKPVLEKLIFGPFDTKSETEIDNKLNAEIEGLCELLYDLISHLMPFGQTVVLGKNASELTDLFKKVFKKSFSNPYLLTNIVLSVKDIFLEALKKADTEDSPQGLSSKFVSSLMT